MFKKLVLLGLAAVGTVRTLRRFADRESLRRRRAQQHDDLQRWEGEGGTPLPSLNARAPKPRRRAGGGGSRAAPTSARASTVRS